MKRPTKFAIAIGATLGIAAATAGIAYGAWTVSGSGTGSGAATIAQGLTITASTPTGANATLYPGGPASGVYFTVSNPNPFTVTITAITWGTPSSGSPTSCPNSNISLDAGAPTTGLNIVVPPNPQTGVFTVPGVLDLVHSAPNGCQGMTFNVPMTVTAVQQ